MVPRLRSAPDRSSDRMMAKQEKVFKEEEEENAERVPRRSYLQIKAILKRRKKQTTTPQQVREQPVNLLRAMEAKLESDQQRKALGEYICPLKVPRTVERTPTYRGFEGTKLLFMMAQGLLPKSGSTSRKEMKRSKEQGADDADERGKRNKFKVVTTGGVSVRLNDF